MSQEAKLDFKENCIQRSILKGLKSGFFTFSVSGLGVFMLNLYSPSFRNGLGISGKASLVTMPMLFMFFLDSHLEMGVCTEEQQQAKKPPV